MWDRERDGGVEMWAKERDRKKSTVKATHFFYFLILKNVVDFFLFHPHFLLYEERACQVEDL